MPTSVDEWRARNRPQEVELPSGCVALLQKVNLLDLVVQGSIPTTLLVEAAEIAQDRNGSLSMLQSPERVKELSGLLNPLVKAAFVEPKVGDESTTDQLSVDEIDTADKLAILKWCNEGVDALLPFRGEQAGDVEPAHDGKGIRETA
jgi:hypothetical protein